MNVNRSNTTFFLIWIIVVVLFFLTLFQFGNELFRDHSSHSFISMDEQLFLWLNNLGNSNWDWFWLFVTNQKNWLVVYALAVIVVARQMDNWLKFSIFIFFALLLIVTVDVSIANVMKPFFHRLRPCNNEDLVAKLRLVQSACDDQYSFFSGHSANSFAIIGILLLSFNLSNWLKLLIILWACTVAYSRVYVGMHFPFDILIGALYGWTWSMIIYLSYNRLMKAVFK